MITLADTTHVAPRVWHWGNVEPLTGSPDEIAAGIQAFVDAGISHIQLHLEPNTLQTLERFGAVLDTLQA